LVIAQALTLVSGASQACPWRIDILTDFGGNRAGQLRRATVANAPDGGEITKSSQPRRANSEWFH
jgi:hypothetical protein